MSYSLEWKVLQCHCPQHETHVSKLFSNCTMSGSCLPSLHFTNTGLLWKSMQKACLIRGSILQHAQGLDASELVLRRLQNDTQWNYTLAKVVSVITLCTKCVCCNRIWTKVLCCKLAIFSPANCKQRLYKLWTEAVQTVSHRWRLPEVLRKKPPCSKNNTRYKAALAEERRVKIRNQIPENVKASSVLKLCILQCWNSLWIAEFPDSPSWFISNHAFL